MRRRNAGWYRCGYEGGYTGRKHSGNTTWLSGGDSSGN